jgi:ribose transport system substrate-binding protein
MMKRSCASNSKLLGKMFVGLLLAAVCGGAGCRKQSTTVAVIPRSTGTTLWSPMRDGIEEAAKGTGLEVQWNAPPDGGDVENQLDLLEASTKRRDRGIIFVPDETLASRSMALKAVAKRIPVVVVGDDFGPPAGPFLSYVGNDEKAGVKLAVDRLSQQLHGSGTVAIIGINVRQEGSITREVLFERALSESAPGIRIVLREYGNTVIKNQQICEELLDSASPPDAIVALSAAATRGAYYAKIAESHPKATIVIGFDQGVMVPLRSGNVDSVVVQDTRAIGKRAMENVLAQSRGETVAAETLVEPHLATQENLDSPEIAGMLRSASSAKSGDAAELDMAAASARFRREAKLHEIQPGVRPIGEFIRLPGTHPGVTVQGTVISLPPMLEVQDVTSSLLVSTFTSAEPLKLGDVVTVHGDLTSERFRSRMENASIKVLWAERPVPPLAVTATQLTANYRGEWIEVEGTVVSEKNDDGPLELILQDERQTYRALVYGPSSAKAPRFAPGSRVRLRGSATSLPELSNGIYPFTIVADRVELLSPPPWWSPAHIVMVLLAALAVLLAFQWLLHQIRHWQMRAILREREELAYEMHDTLAQSFTGIGYQLQAARAERRGEDAVREHIDTALRLVSMSHREASRTIAALRPQQHDAPGILTALRQSAERLSTGGDLTIRTVLNARSPELPLEVADAFIRIGEEAINNAIQHGGCHNLSIELHVQRREATLIIKDDGQGFFLEDEEHKGLGIAGMRSRAEKIKADLNVTSRPGEGTTISVVCPLVFTGSLLYWLRAKLGADSISRSAF